MSNPHATCQLVRSHLSFVRLQHRSAVLHIDGESYGMRAHQRHTHNLRDAASPPSVTNPPPPPERSTGELQ
jgi:hypothetical protein